MSKKEEKEEIKDIYDVLLDENNKDPIILVDSNGIKTTFEQIAVIPYNDKLYCILKPLDKIKGVQDDEAIVFFVEETPERNFLKIEENGLTVMKVFKEYYEMLQEYPKDD